MIHACRGREWYVNEFLVPSLEAQGLDNITLWVDRDDRGNLASCVESFYQVSKRGGETWHLQDDVIICRDFAERIQRAPPGVVCGFCVEKYEKAVYSGEVSTQYMWESSFPCIKIPDALAGEFVEWLTTSDRDDLKPLIQTGKKDDTLFRIFMLEEHFRDRACNMRPHLVDHIDYLIGGSMVNQTRGFWARAMYFEDHDLITELQSKLASR